MTAPFLHPGPANVMDLDRRKAESRKLQAGGGQETEGQAGQEVRNYCGHLTVVPKTDVLTLTFFDSSVCTSWTGLYWNFLEQCPMDEGQKNLKAIDIL
jgi:hypothetical protein